MRAARVTQDRRLRRLWPVALALGWGLSGGIGAAPGAPIPPDRLAEREVVEGALATDDPSTRYDQGELRLSEVKSGRSLQGGQDGINPIRAEALKEAALAYGARAGLYARMREINHGLDEEARTLDQNFPFGPLILAHNVVPPVIQTGRNTVRQHDHRQLQFADAVYEILAPARLAVAPPDWRTYLYVRAHRPEPPDETLLPDRSQAAEGAFWEKYVELGWRRGVLQADQTFTVQLNRLERDLRGMALYRELLAKGMVTAPRLTEQLRGVTTHGPTLMVNDRLLEIAENTRFVADDQRWKPYPTRPYRPPKSAPPIHLRVLGDPPVAVAPAPVPAPVSPWEERNEWPR